MSVRVHPVVLRMRDDDGKWVTEGDTVHFSYGIPPVGVSARIIERGGKLIGLCPGHNPPEFNLRFLRHYVCSWYKHNADHQARVLLSPECSGSPSSSGGEA